MGGEVLPDGGTQEVLGHQQKLIGRRRRRTGDLQPLGVLSEELGREGRCEGGIIRVGWST